MEKDKLSNIRSLNGKLQNLTYGTKGNNVNSVDITSFINKEFGGLETKSTGLSFINQIMTIAKSNNFSEKEKLQQLKDSIQSNSELASFEKIFQQLNKEITKYDDLQVVTSLLPQLKEAKKAITDSILSPDDFTKKVVISLFSNGSPMIEENPQLNNLIQNLLFTDYKYDKIIKRIVSETITFGKHYVMAVPYDEMYNRFEERKKNNKEMMRENVNLLNEKSEIDEEFIGELNEYLAEDLTKNDFIDIANDFFISESSLDIDENIDILLEAQSLKQKKNKSKQTSKQSKTKTADGMMDSNKKQSKEDRIKGCYIKHLDLRNLLPLKINDIILGYYYIENDETKTVLKSGKKFNFKSGISDSSMSTNVEKIYKSLADLISKRIDKKIILKNPELKDKLCQILEYNESLERKVKIIFIDPDDVVEFEIDNGESVFETGLYFAKIYFTLMTVATVMRISRANDVRIHYVSTDPNGGISTQVSNAITDLRKNNKSILRINHISSIFSNIAQFNDVFVPQPYDSQQKPIESDVIQGQQINMSDDLLDKIENIFVSTTGFPLQLMLNSDEPDFARTYAMLNEKFLRRITSLQGDLNTGNTELIRRIADSEVDGEEMENAIQRMYATFQTSLSLTTANLLDQINNAKDLSTSLVSLLLGDSQEDTELIANVQLRIAKLYLPNIDTDRLFKIVKEEIINLEKERLSPKVPVSRDEMPEIKIAEPPQPEEPEDTMSSDTGEEGMDSSTEESNSDDELTDDTGSVSTDLDNTEEDENESEDEDSGDEDLDNAGTLSSDEDEEDSGEESEEEKKKSEKKKSSKKEDNLDDIGKM